VHFSISVRSIARGSVAVAVAIAFCVAAAFFIGVLRYRDADADQEYDEPNREEYDTADEADDD
jgi:heme/copper-type cytochrome/quinol oxidase subunit 2